MLFLDFFYCHRIADLWGRIARPQNGGEILDSNTIGSAENGRPLNRIAQFADVARPLVSA